jgi:hypothetical protein
MPRFDSLATLVGLAFAGVVAAQIPYFPNVTDPNFPLGSRCIDYCAFLKPDELCPGHPADVSCLCEVYNQRLAPVTPNAFLARLTDCSVKNAGPTKMPRLPMTFSLLKAFAHRSSRLLPSRPLPAAQLYQPQRPPPPHSSRKQVLQPLTLAVEPPRRPSKQLADLPRLGWALVTFAFSDM